MCPNNIYVWGWMCVEFRGLKNELTKTARSVGTIDPWYSLVRYSEPITMMRTWTRSRYSSLLRSIWTMIKVTSKGQKNECDVPSACYSPIYIYILGVSQQINHPSRRKNFPYLSLYILILSIYILWEFIPSLSYNLLLRNTFIIPSVSFHILRRNILTIFDDISIKHNTRRGSFRIFFIKTR